MQHDCIQETRIGELETKNAVLSKSDERQEVALLRIEDKVDKILYFILGISTTACVAVIGLLFKGVI